MCSSFPFTLDTFDGVAIAVGLVAESQTMTRQRRLEPRRTVDEKERVPGVVFLLQFAEKHLRQDGRSTSTEPDMEEMVRCRIDGGVQPVPLVLDLDHGLVDRNSIRRFALDGL